MDDSPSYDATDKESDSELDSLYDALKKHDDIRFATYRTAAKLRYIQRKAFLHHIDIWNMIEAFRENGLNTLEPGTLVNRSRLETLLASLYSNLNKRLPPGQSIDIEKTSCMLSTWLMFTYCSDDSGRLRVFSVKIAMAVLSCGKLMDKFRYMFSQLNDCNGHLSPRRCVGRNGHSKCSITSYKKTFFFQPLLDPVPERHLTPPGCGGRASDLQLEQ